MARPASKFILVLAAGLVLPAAASAQNYDYLSRSDGISIASGDANAANLAIQTPTPWPYYVNDVTIPGIGIHGESIMESFYKKYKKSPGPVTNSTVVNVTSPAQ